HRSIRLRELCRLASLRESQDQALQRTSPRSILQMTPDAVISEAPTLMDFFPNYVDPPRMELVASSEVPPPYRDLLVHTHHMTVTVEAFHHDRVNVRIPERYLTDEWYARRIFLTKETTGEVVQFGIARIRLKYCSP